MWCWQEDDRFVDCRYLSIANTDNHSLVHSIDNNSSIVMKKIKIRAPEHWYLCKCINSWTKCNKDRSIHPSVGQLYARLHYKIWSDGADFIFPSFQFLILFLSSVLWSNPSFGAIISSRIEANDEAESFELKRRALIRKTIIESQVIAKRNVKNNVVDHHCDLHYR